MGLAMAYLDSALYNKIFELELCFHELYVS